jgi:hypothetical protein
VWGFRGRELGKGEGEVVWWRPSEAWKEWRADEVSMSPEGVCRRETRDVTAREGTSGDFRTRGGREIATRIAILLNSAFCACLARSKGSAARSGT